MDWQSDAYFFTSMGSSWVSDDLLSSKKKSISNVDQLKELQANRYIGTFIPKIGNNKPTIA